jgi:hypothetical protein
MVADLKVTRNIYIEGLAISKKVWSAYKKLSIFLLISANLQDLSRFFAVYGLTFCFSYIVWRTPHASTKAPDLKIKKEYATRASFYQT